MLETYTLTIALIFVIIIGALLLILEFHRTSLANKRVEDKAHELITNALKKSQEVLANSETEALKITSDSKFFKEKYEGEIAEKIEQSLSKYQLVYQQSIEIIKSQLEQATKDYTEYLKYLKNESDRSRNESVQVIKSEISEMFLKIEQDLTEFLRETQERSVSAVDLELKATRGLIDNYKNSQLKLVDENIIAVLERTLSLVLAKKLSLSDHTELIFDSLEKAKSEKFIL